MMIININIWIWGEYINKLSMDGGMVLGGWEVDGV